MAEDNKAGEILAEAGRIAAGWRAEGRTRDDLLAEFGGEVLGVERDWPIEIIREHYLDTIGG